MKKIFCLCVIITLGTHSMHAGIRDDAFKCVSTAAKGTGGIAYGLLSFELLRQGVNFASDNTSNKDVEANQAAVNRMLLLAVGVGCGYVAYKLGRSSFRDIGLVVSRKSRKSKGKLESISPEKL
ncbi:hypothetical protein E3J79_02935 [Candidatus Dependentiae bacterium]|nr:MAG: hypothetical protein E3J79_02935 [Candidatus Dependentiae bacterium]